MTRTAPPLLVACTLLLTATIPVHAQQPEPQLPPMPSMEGQQGDMGKPLTGKPVPNKPAPGKPTAVKPAAGKPTASKPAGAPRKEPVRKPAKPGAHARKR